MPYIDKERRCFIKPGIEEASGCIYNTGDLTYAMFLLCVEFMASEGESYDNYSKCLAALESAKLEFYRRFVGPYEDKKIMENGDIQI